MNNRENFDMDVGPNRNDNGGGKKKDSKTRNTILVIIPTILLIIAAIMVYFTLIKTPDDSSKQTIVVEKTEVTEQQTDSVDEKDILQLPADTSPTPVDMESASVQPVVSPIKQNNVAKDLSNAKNEKALEGAIQFQDHIVMDGESLNSIAQLYGLNVQTLISVNSIKNIAGVTAGTVLSIPDRNGHYYIVQKGDMLSTIATEYSPTLGWKTLQELNGLSDTKLDVGDKIFIPDMSEIASHPAMSKAVTSFIDPSTGRVMARYGQEIENNIYDESAKLSGILIIGNSSVKAASDGKVLDMGSTDETSFIVISHKNSYQTIYKNVKNVSVEIGQEVKQGDVIAEVDVVGDKKQPILYFAIEQSGIPLDPESFF
ncbi:MAG: LysM peptidoglycan-binding domain-containing protein [Sphaerochaeta sp.]